jgi:ethanolamine permease
MTMTDRPVDTAETTKGSLGWGSLSTLGVAFAAAGCFAPWSYGIDLAGWSGMLVAFGIVALFYLCLLLCMAELASTIPSAGAGQAFASRAFSPAIGFVAGAASLIQYVCGTSALGYLVASYLQPMTGIDIRVTIVVLYVVVVAIHTRGIRESTVLTIILSMLALAGVLLFAVATGGSIDPKAAFGNLKGADVNLSTVWPALPFAVTFLLGLEGVAFAAEEARDPTRDIPKGLLVAFTVTTLFGILTLVTGPAGAGLASLHGSDAPMLAALTSPNVHAPAVIVFAVNAAGLCGIGVSFFSSVFGYSRQVAAMAQDHELPSFLAKISRRNVPVYALVVPSAIGMVVALSGKLDQLIVLMVFAGAISYVMMFMSFLSLRLRSPGIRRPYRVRGGVMIAIVGLSLGALIFSACIATDLMWSLYGALMLLVLLGYRLTSSRSVGTRTSVGD